METSQRTERNSHWGGEARENLPPLPPSTFNPHPEEAEVVKGEIEHEEKPAPQGNYKGEQQQQQQCRNLLRKARNYYMCLADLVSKSVPENRTERKTGPGLANSRRVWLRMDGILMYCVRRGGWDILGQILSEKG